MRAMRLSPHDPHTFNMQSVVAAGHFFAGRYVFVALIGVAVGLGVVLARLWILKSILGKGVAIVVLAACIAMWLRRVESIIPRSRLAGRVRDSLCRKAATCNLAVSSHDRT